MRTPTRRHTIGALGTTLSLAVSGCAMTRSEDPDQMTPTFEQLDTVAVYIADDVSLSVPSTIETVQAPTNADVAILSGEPRISTETALEWLTDDRIIALVGDGAQATWLAWAESESFKDTFKNRGRAKADPGPDLLVGTTANLRLRTYRHTWAGGPDEGDILRALDEILVEIAKETTQEG